MSLPFSRPILDSNTCVDFFAGNEVALLQLMPVWEAMPHARKGIFYTWERREGTETFSNYLPGYNPMVVGNANDLSHVFYAGEERPFILVESAHISQTRGLLVAVSLFLCADPKDAAIRTAYAEKHQTVAHYGTAGEIPAAIETFIQGVTPTYRNKCGEESIGLIYMAFGDKARDAVRRSVATLKRIGFSYPVCVVGDKAIPEFEFREWHGQSPFDPTQKKNFQFRAGRVKPFLYDLSPFDRTLYLDADTEFVQDVFEGFKLLEAHGMMLTQEYLTVGELYNKFMAGWEINIEERAKTIEEGTSPDEKFVNSGVIFFRKDPATQEVFSRWSQEWLRFQQWDEQLALMRAIRDSGVSRKYLTPRWNDPHVHDDTIIFHNYGRGNVRTSI